MKKYVSNTWHKGGNANIILGYSQENGKKSIFGAIKEYQAEDKQKPKVKQESSKEAER